MKKIIIILLLFALPTIAQEKIKGIIETEGHIVKNDTLKNPFTVKYDLYGVEIKRENEIFERQKCQIEKCKIIHLKKKVLMGAYFITNNNLFTTTTH
jgi:hypothetical protein